MSRNHVAPDFPCSPERARLGFDGRGCQPLPDIEALLGGSILYNKELCLPFAGGLVH